MITDNEIKLLDNALRTALEAGAQKARLTLVWSRMDAYATLNGALDKVNRCQDRSLTACLFVDGRYGSFSTNRLEKDALNAFLQKAVATVRMLAPDPCRDLPDPSRTARDAVTGRELGLLDPVCGHLDADRKCGFALQAAVFPACGGRTLTTPAGKTCTLISEEGEYSDTLVDLILIDSNGLRCRHTESTFEYGVETTVQDSEGHKYSDYWWHSAPMLDQLELNVVGRTALERAAARIGPENPPCGKYRLVVDSECAAKLIDPLLKALSGYSLQQQNSFLPDSLGKRIFPEGFTLVDRARKPGESGSRLFDTEGVATRDGPIIADGVVREYFINTYMAGKMGMAPTVEDATRPQLLRYLSPALGECSGVLDRDEILRRVGDGILVTGFNGGNSNPSTGDFSYGIEGFRFADGKLLHPVREMLITGNFLTLWNGLLAAGEDARFCMSKLIPTLAFENVDFSS